MNFGFITYSTESPISDYERPIATAKAGPDVISSLSPRAAYVHIPFCRRRCFYCDFPVSVVGDRRNGSNSGTIAQYLDVLCQEILACPTQGLPLQTVFFGGGTPSLLTPEQLGRILGVLDRQFRIQSDAEIAIEMDPGTFDLPQLQSYRLVGVNRVSLGVQAFQNSLLQQSGRSHTVEEVYAAVECLQQAGIVNWSLDLMSGLPYQTLEHWQESLAQAIQLAPTHLSTYDLTIEPGTPFSRQYRPGDRPLPSDEITADMYRLAHQQLTQAGYDHYEISNYARPGYQCRHNRVYWENCPFYGFGMGAASYLRGERLTRPRTLREYYEWVKTQNDRLSLPIKSPDLLDTLMLGLRLAEGLDLQKLEQQFGSITLKKIGQCLQPYHDQGWVGVAGADWQGSSLPPSGRLQLTQPEGFLFSNVMLVALFEALS